jgi:hypothetical protein
MITFGLPDNVGGDHSKANGQLLRSRIHQSVDMVAKHSCGSKIESAGRQRVSRPSITTVIEAAALGNDSTLHRKLISAPSNCGSISALTPRGRSRIDRRA